MTAPTMTINGIEYVEAKPTIKGLCQGCEFFIGGGFEDDCCSDDFDIAEQHAFGASCVDRNVIYLRKDSPAAP